MPELNHTIVWSSDKRRAAEFTAEILGLPAPRKFFHFEIVDLDNGVSLDFLDNEEPLTVQHYAFLVSDAEFDAGLARVKTKGLTFWADPARTQANEINHHFGGRGFYFENPDGHLLELITRPYGSESELEAG
jgi:catechol 2,3-dioxygenase-like lactoylglutathione lyase family enzyme